MKHIVLLWLLWPLAAGAFEPQLFTAHYEIELSGFKIGEMTRSQRRTETGDYLLESEMFTTGLVSLFKKDRVKERSTWRLNGHRPKPLAYKAHYTGRDKDVTERLDFDWQRGVVTSLRDGRETELPAEAGMLDKMMYEVRLRQQLAEGETRFHYRVADRSKVEDYDLEVVGEETLNTALGKLHTVKVRKGTTTVWHAVDYGYLPVKLVQDEEDHTLRSTITSLKLH